MERFSLTENITQQYLILHLLEFNNESYSLLLHYKPSL